MKLHFTYTYPNMKWEDVLSAYIWCKQNKASEFENLEGVGFQCTVSHPVPRSVAPLIPWLTSVELKEMARYDMEKQTLTCVVVNECSKTHMEITQSGKNTRAVASTVIDTTGWNPLVTAATPTIAQARFKALRDKELKRARVIAV